MINSFDGDYAFLSNFYPSEIIYGIGDNGGVLIARTVEHAFQAAKAEKREEELEILKASTPGQAKKWGRRCVIREDWEVIKNSVMYNYVNRKFANSELRQKLLDTGNEYLEEGNTWHDNYWGNCYCERCANIKGRNKLGEILMTIREKIRNG